MRSDMNKVLTERPRHHGGVATKKTGGKLRLANLDDENDIAGEVSRIPSGRRRVYGWASKELSDHLKPLERYLESKVGQPWDKVWSEISETLDRRSMSGNHVFEHLRWMVELCTCMIDGKVMELSRGDGVPRKVDGLYVHPTTGILCNNPYKRPKWEKKKDPNFLDGPTEFHRYTKIDGIWYLSEYKRTVDKKHSGRRSTYWHEQEPADYGWFKVDFKYEWDETVEIHGRDYVFHRTSIRANMSRIGKRQLSAAELRKIGLKNDPSSAQMSRRQLKRMYGK